VEGVKELIEMLIDLNEVKNLTNYSILSILVGTINALGNDMKKLDERIRKIESQLGGNINTPAVSSGEGKDNEG